MDQSNALKQLATQEAARNDNRQIKRVLKKLNKASVSTIEVDQDDGSSKDITARRDIETYCLQENYKKCTQTESTICIKDQQRTLLGST